MGVTASLSKGSGNSNGTEVTNVNTNVTGNQVSITSGGDTTLKGAVVTGNQVTANVGGNLNVQSLQDTSTYQSQSSSSGFSVTVPIGVGSFGGSISATKTNVNNDYQSVGTQTAIQAGNAGFQVNVQGSTSLNGAVIASTQSAIDNNKNSFKTGGTLTTTDLQNTSSYNANSVGVTLGVTGAGQQNASPVSGAGVGSASGNAASTSTAGISGLAGNTNVRTGNAQTGLQNTFNAATTTANVQAQVAITQEFGKQASKAVGDYAAMQLTKATDLLKAASTTTDPVQAQSLKDQAAQLQSDWGDNGTLRLAAHTVIGGLTGGTDGALGAAAGTLTAPLVANALQTSNIDPTLSKILTGLASMTLTLTQKI